MHALADSNSPASEGQEPPVVGVVGVSEGVVDVAGSGVVATIQMTLYVSPLDYGGQNSMSCTYPPML